MALVMERPTTEIGQMQLATMNKTERSLLLYLESRATDHGGLVDTKHMNSEDIEIAHEWTKEGFVDFQRLASECLNPNRSTHCCFLSEEAWALAHAERRARHERMSSKRKWYSVVEKRSAA
jgi:hypothetical protein